MKGFEIQWVYGMGVVDRSFAFSSMIVEENVINYYDCWRWQLDRERDVESAVFVVILIVLCSDLREGRTKMRGQVRS